MTIVGRPRHGTAHRHSAIAISGCQNRNCFRCSSQTSGKGSMKSARVKVAGCVLLMIASWMSGEDQAQDSGGVAGACDPLIGCDLLDAFVLSLGQPAVPAMGPDQSIDQRDVRLHIAVRVNRLADEGALQLCATQRGRVRGT